MRAARAAKGMTSAASALIADMPLRRLADIEEGDQVAYGDDLRRFAEAHGIDSYSVVLWAIGDLIERVMNRESWPPNMAQDEDLYELYDQMVMYLAERGRI